MIYLFRSCVNSVLVGEACVLSPSFLWDDRAGVGDMGTWGHQATSHNLRYSCFASKKAGLRLSVL